MDGTTLTGSILKPVKTACYMAPEMIKFVNASKSSNVYRFVIVLRDVFTRNIVYGDVEVTQIISQVVYYVVMGNLPIYLTLENN